MMINMPITSLFVLQNLGTKVQILVCIVWLVNMIGNHDYYDHIFSDLSTRNFRMTKRVKRGSISAVDITQAYEKSLEYELSDDVWVTPRMKAFVQV